VQIGLCLGLFNFASVSFCAMDPLSLMAFAQQVSTRIEFHPDGEKTHPATVPLFQIN